MNQNEIADIVNVYIEETTKANNELRAQKRKIAKVRMVGLAATFIVGIAAGITADQKR